VDDLTTLSHLHEPAVLENIRVRYAQKVIYTYSGIVLVAVNPFQKVNLYGQDMIKAYAGKQKGDLEPHLFSVAEDAFRCLVREGRNQSIIVTGESGAGKTVSTKFVMRYFATVESEVATKMSDVEEQVLATNPIMESFGNAKTIRNNNSSRFGKYLEIKFSKQHKIVAASIRTFLLERSRVVFQARDERGYHIFYQLCSGAPLAEREDLGLGDSYETFHYLSQGGSGVVEDVDDAADFKETQGALSKVGMSVAQQWKVFRLLAGLLHLGNIRITEVSKRLQDATISPTDEALIRAARLLAIDAEAFSRWILRRTIKTQSETIVKNRDTAEATASRDAVAKFIYATLFDWLVAAINRSLNHPTGGSKLFIGLLDIYGFEIFKVNSFEQFCINYANEKLQQEFVQHVFKLEQEEYVKEGITWSFIDYLDNQPCIDLIEAKLGVLGLLDEECRLPKGTDESLVNKLYAQLKDHPFFAKPRFSNTGFTIKHYAQEVTYEVAGFLEKNKDSISDEQMAVLLATKEPLYAEIFSEAITTSAAAAVAAASSSSSPQKKDPSAAAGAKAGQKATLGSSFKTSLASLMETLRGTTPNYIRCIKPNEQKAAFVFEPVHVLSQLRACGVLETIRISAAGYPSRTGFAQFAERYRPLAPKTAKLRDDGRQYCQAILEALIHNEDKFRVGKTKIFLRAGQLALLEKMRLEKLNRAATIIQKHARRMIQVKRCKMIRLAVLHAQRRKPLLHPCLSCVCLGGLNPTICLVVFFFFFVSHQRLSRPPPVQEDEEGSCRHGHSEGVAGPRAETVLCRGPREGPGDSAGLACAGGQKGDGADAAVQRGGDNPASFQGSSGARLLQEDAAAGGVHPVLSPPPNRAQAAPGAQDRGQVTDAVQRGLLQAGEQGGGADPAAQRGKGAGEAGAGKGELAPGGGYGTAAARRGAQTLQGRGHRAAAAKGRFGEAARGGSERERGPEEAGDRARGKAAKA